MSEKEEFLDAVCITLQLWAKGDIKECPVPLAYLQINLMCGRIDRITEKLKEANNAPSKA